MSVRVKFCEAIAESKFCIMFLSLLGESRTGIKFEPELKKAN